MLNGQTSDLRMTEKMANEPVSRDLSRLSSWGEIAQYLNVSEKTARRWEQQRGMPVHRIPGGGPKAGVYAFRSEIDAWLQPPVAGVVPVHLESGGGGGASPVLSRRWWVAAAILITFAGIAGGIALRSPGLRIRESLLGEPERVLASTAAKLVPVMTDGRNVFVQEKEQGRFRIVWAALDAFEKKGPQAGAVLETNLEKPDPGVVAPDGKSLLLRNLSLPGQMDQPLFRQPLPGGSAERVGEVLAYDSAWTPDQKQIVFSRQTSVFVTDPSGGAVRKLFDVPGRAYWFRWRRPGDQRFRFTVYRSQNHSYRIWEAAADWSAAHPVDFGLEGDVSQACGAWDAEGRRFFFQAAVAGFFQIFVHEEAAAGFGSGSLRQLTSGPVHATSPVPVQTAGGSRLLLGLLQSHKSEVVRYERETRRWVPLFEGVSASAVAYSPDGKRLAFVRMPEASLWRCEMPGCRNPVELTSGPGRVAMPRWSPDGREISIMMRLPGKQWRAAIVTAEGAGAMRWLLPGNVDGTEADPSWSPDGARIAFGAPPNPDTGAEAEIRVLERGSGKVEVVPGSRGFHTPHWSPDGKYLAAVRWPAREVAIFEFATGRWRVAEGTRAGYLNWSADGRRVYFRSMRPEAPAAVEAVEAGSLRVMEVAELQGFRQPAWSFGEWIGVDPQGTPLALRDLTTDEVVRWRLAKSIAKGHSWSPD